MSEISIQNPSAANLIDTDPGFAVVQVRAAWGDDWETVPYLEAVGDAFNRAGLARSEAKLLWRYGQIKREDLNSFTAYLPKDLFGKYVRICVSTSKGLTPRWYGVIDDDALDIKGKDPAPTGDQSIQCWGLDHLLDRYTVRQVKYTTDGNTVYTIERIPVFNRRTKRGNSLLGNRTSGTTEEDVDAFSSDGAVWTNFQILQSLLLWNLPSDAPPFTLAGQDALLKQIEQVHDFKSGTPLREVLNKLIDRRRGMVWCLRISENEEVNIWVSSILDESVSVGGTTIEKNTEQSVVTVDQDKKISEVVISKVTSSRYNRLVARGGLLKCIFSVSKDDGTLEWAATSTLILDYKAGAAEADGYDALPTDKDKALWNDDFRAEDKFDRIGMFRIPNTWNKSVKDGWGGGESFVAVPSVKDDGTVLTDAAANLWLFDRALLQHLPALEVGKDYSVEPPTDENPSGDEPEFRKPFIVILHEDKYVYLDKHGDREEPPLPHASIRMLDREMAMQVDIRPRHLLMKTDWSGAEPSYINGKPFDAASVFDWRKMIATVAIEADQHLREVVDDGSGGNREIVIDVPDAELVYLAPNTVLGIDADGSLKRAPAEGTFIRNDLEALERVAALAWAWYSKPRASVKITKRGFAPILAVGAMVKSAQASDASRDVGTVVTEERINWGKREVSISTNFENVDFADFGPTLTTRAAVGSEIRSLNAKCQELNERTSGLPTRIAAPSAVGGGASGEYAHVAVDAAGSLGATVDGVSIGTGDRVLVFDDGDDNGIYERQSGGGFECVVEFTAAKIGISVAIFDGDDNGQTFFACSEENTLQKMGAFYR